MRNRIIYVELKSGYADDGPAWIGYAGYSKTGATIYFDGKAFKSLKGSGIGANYYEVESGDQYWISGVKKNGQDRHWAGGGNVEIEESCVSEYLEEVGASSLPRNFKVTKLGPSKSTKAQHLAENEMYRAEEEPVLGRRPISKTVNRLKKDG